jgi:hypothetical protein
MHPCSHYGQKLFIVGLDVRRLHLGWLGDVFKLYIECWQCEGFVKVASYPFSGWLAFLNDTKYPNFAVC